MIHLSFSSFFISLIMSTILIFLLDIILKSKRNYKKFRIDFMILSMIIILFRLLFPFEYIHTFSIPSPFFMNGIVYGLHIHLFNIEIYKYLIGIWIIGIIVSFMYFFKELLTIKKLIQSIIPYKKVYKDIVYYQCPFVSSAMVIGLKGYILLPMIDLSEELEDILEHEKCHIQNHDILKKYLFHMIMCIYWWFYPIYKLNKQINLILEMNVDIQMTKNKEEKEVLSYSQHLISCLKQYQSKLSTGFSIDEGYNLSYRIHYLLDGYKIKRTNILFLYSLILICFLSTLFVLEPVGKNMNGIYDRMNSDAYIIHYKDDTYRLFIDGVDIGLIEDYSDPSLEGIERIEE